MVWPAARRWESRGSENWPEGGRFEGREAVIRRYWDFDEALEAVGLRGEADK